jgi:cell division septum initiation protein DivIVA
MAHPEEPPPGGPVAAFSVVRQGYDRTQVNRYFQQLEASSRHTATERDYFQRQAAELAGQLEAARAQIATLSARPEPPTIAEAAPLRDDRAARVVAVAKSQADEIIARAQNAAEHTWAAAEQASVALRERYQQLLADLDRQQAEIHTAHQTIMESARARSEEMTAAAERRRREIDAAAEHDRIRIDREFSESMNSKRTALRKEVEAARAASEAEAARRIHEANEIADRRLAAATAEVDRLTALRDQLAAQLRDTHQLVERVTATLAPAEQEQSFEDTLLFPPVEEKPAAKS